MSRKWQDDGYLPVEPDSQIVHENGQTIGTTQCGKLVAWCKNVMLISIKNSKWCPNCFPAEERISNVDRD